MDIRVESELSRVFKHFHRAWRKLLGLSFFASFLPWNEYVLRSCWKLERETFIIIRIWYNVSSGTWQLDNLSAEYVSIFWQFTSFTELMDLFLKLAIGPIYQLRWRLTSLLLR